MLTILLLVVLCGGFLGCIRHCETCNGTGTYKSILRDKSYDVTCLDCLGTGDASFDAHVLDYQSALMADAEEKYMAWDNHSTPENRQEMYDAFREANRKYKEVFGTYIPLFSGLVRL